MIDYKYAYLFGTLVCLVIWLIFFLIRKDYRKEMLVMGVIFIFPGLIGEYLWWTKDWWRPQTFTGTVIGIEDILLGFTNGGIAAVIYEEIFKKRFYKRSLNRLRRNDLEIFFLSLFIFLIICLVVYVMKLTSFYATILGMSLVSLIIFYFRKDLIINAFVSGFLMVLITLPVYLLLILFFPEIVDQFWLHDYLWGINLFGIPLEDILFYFFVGFSAGPFYEFWKGKKLANLD